MDKKFEALFIAYLEKTISPQDEKLFIQILNNNPTLLQKLKDYSQVWNLAGFSKDFNPELFQKEWELLLLKIKIAENESKKKQQNFWYWLPRIAAVFLFGAVISLAVTYQIFNSSNKDLVYHEINTPPGAKSKVTLPDGTTIWLNAGSNLKYSNEFGKKDRLVELTGEAYFNVFHNAKKVFLVKTSELNIKAYGTAFNVKSYPEEGTIETTLIEGSIGVTRTSFEKKKNDEVLLEPNQRVVYYRKTKQVERIQEEITPATPEAIPVKREEQKLTYLISKGIETIEYTSWKDGTLFITSETLQNLAVKLERKYDVRIHFDSDELKNLKFTGSLENETVEQVINAIGIAAQIDYEIEDRDIWLKEQTK